MTKNKFTTISLSRRNYDRLDYLRRGMSFADYIDKLTHNIQNPDQRTSDANGKICDRLCVMITIHAHQKLKSMITAGDTMDSVVGDLIDQYIKFDSEGENRGQ